MGASGGLVAGSGVCDALRELCCTGDKIDISVVTFPGDGGSDADNINRWRQQIGLPQRQKRAPRSFR